MKKEEVIAHFGSISKTARALGITHVSVISWGEEIPELRAYQVEVVTKGALKVDEMKYRPAAV